MHVRPLIVTVLGVVALGCWQNGMGYAATRYAVCSSRIQVRHQDRETGPRPP